MTTLQDMRSGDSGIIVGLAESGSAYRKKLLSMGLTPGTAFQVTRVAPLGDPIELRIRGFDLSLRKHEARILNVEKSATP